ncbi:hypothetical protein [Pararhodospirillum oryzae]|uniref:Uncharacterized protein n=1 Tax=Pararhodospirillum oryzae TaxID=478448 RepID=A0A512H3P1_9PROT|nr:hypothetical protein [Pararhodospirillum oryzae]GEO80074.1 hypothetical protein ROR02_02050 [Pararhodospirillum oryzae]
MSDLMLNQIQVLLNKLSDDVARMGDLSSEQINNLLNMMEGLAAHVLGTRAVVAALVKKYPVEMADVEAFFAEGENPPAEDVLAVARHLVEGEQPKD